MYVYWESEKSENSYEAAIVYTDFIQGSPIIPPGFSARIPQGSIAFATNESYNNYIITKLPFEDNYALASNPTSIRYPYYRFRVAFKTEYGIIFSEISKNCINYLNL